MLSVQFRAGLFIHFFKKKILNAQKHSRAKINQQSKIKETLNNKANYFLLVKKLLRG